MIGLVLFRFFEWSGLKEPKSILHDQGRDIYQIGYFLLHNALVLDKE